LKFYAKKEISGFALFDIIKKKFEVIARKLALQQHLQNLLKILARNYEITFHLKLLIT
jgi:hypothetical protein